MDKSTSNNRLSKLVADLDEDTVLKLVRQRLDAGDDPLQIINECNEGMREVGLRYESGEYYVAGLIMSGEIFREVVEIAQPFLAQQTDGKVSGRVLVGTVSGDIHDIGKNISLECCLPVTALMLLIWVWMFRRMSSPPKPLKQNLTLSGYQVLSPLRSKP